MNIRHFRRYILELISVFGLFLICFIWKLILSTQIEAEIRYCSHKSTVKKILLWNASQRKEVRAFGVGRDVFDRKRCEFTQCEIFTDRREHPLEYYDAIVVVFNDEFLSHEDMTMPEFIHGRNPNQRLVFFTQESPPALRSHYMQHDPIQTFLQLDDDLHDGFRHSFAVRTYHSERIGPY